MLFLLIYVYTPTDAAVEAIIWSHNFLGISVGVHLVEFFCMGGRGVSFITIIDFYLFGVLRKAQDKQGHDIKS